MNRYKNHRIASLAELIGALTIVAHNYEATGRSTDFWKGQVQVAKEAYLTLTSTRVTKDQHRENSVLLRELAGSCQALRSVTTPCGAKFWKEKQTVCEDLATYHLELAHYREPLAL